MLACEKSNAATPKSQKTCREGSTVCDDSLSSAMTTARCACRKLSVQVSGNVRWSQDGLVWTFLLQWRHSRPLDQFHVIGRVKTQLAAVETTFTPALFVLVLQLHQLIPCVAERRPNSHRQWDCHTDSVKTTWQMTDLNQLNFAVFFIPWSLSAASPHCLSTPKHDFLFSGLP